jgi:hypothetical protein
VVIGAFGSCHGLGHVHVRFEKLGAHRQRFHADLRISVSKTGRVSAHYPSCLSLSTTEEVRYLGAQSDREPLQPGQGYVACSAFDHGQVGHRDPGLLGGFPQAESAATALLAGSAPGTCERLHVTTRSLRRR